MAVQIREKKLKSRKTINILFLFFIIFLAFVGAATTFYNIDKIVPVNNFLTITKSLNVSNSLNVDNGTFFVNSSSNRVGIGTTSPEAKLEVEGSIYVTSLSTKNFAEYETNNLGGVSSNESQLIITEGYRSYHGMPLHIPNKTIEGNMSSSGWYDHSEASEPSDAWEYRYFYALASNTSKIAVSNYPPDSGNTRTINGKEYVYIGAARYYNNANGNSPQYTKAISSGNIVWFADDAKNVYGYLIQSKGLRLFYTWNTCSDDRTINITAYIPTTASDITIAHGTYTKVRCDSGCWSLVTSYVYDNSNSYYLHYDKFGYYIQTPIDGNYYPVPHRNTKFVEINRNLYNLSNIKFYYYASTCYADGESGTGAAIIKYKDSAIY